MKNLDYKVKHFKDGMVSFYIRNQKFRANKFYKNDNYFIDSTGFVLASFCCPEEPSDDKKVYVRGSNEEFDFEIISLSVSKFLSFANAVKEYNEQTLKHGEDEYNED